MVRTIASLCACTCECVTIQVRMLVCVSTCACMLESSNPSMLKDFVSQADTKAWPSSCLCVSASNAVHRFQNTTSLAFCRFQLQACLASAKLPSFGRYSYVT